MDQVVADLALQAILGRGPDFDGGIDNDALDFSQLEEFINGDNVTTNTPSGYFGETLTSPTQMTAVTGGATNPTTPTTTNTTPTHTPKLMQKRTDVHPLPDSPPDSSSEHPYSPPDDHNAIPTNSDAIYTTLYKPSNILNDGLMLAPMVPHHHPHHHHHQQQHHHHHPHDGATMLPNDEIVHLTAYNPPHTMDDGMCGDVVYTNLQNAGAATVGAVTVSQQPPPPPPPPPPTQSQTKKRKLSQDAAAVKNEPDHMGAVRLNSPGDASSSLDDDYGGDGACLGENQYQCIRFGPFQQNQWHALCDQNLGELPTPHYRVDADKGFNFSNADDAFVCQKKNHFQITCHVQLLGDAQFVKTPEGFQKISSFHLHFYGVKHDCPTQTIRVEQSQSDRSKKPFHPVLVELVNAQVTKVTVGRLHFSETTSNNMRKKGKPNPEQRYFQLVVGLHAHTTTGNFPVISHASQKIIVRASNPGQFESDVELCWQKGQTSDSIFHNGKIGINTDRPDETLVVHGNIKLTGHVVQPSDLRAKKNVIECDTSVQLRNVQRLRVVRYDYEPTFASQLNRDVRRSDTGVIAQEVAEVLPDAVRPAGDLVLADGTAIDNFLVVNKERIFMENIGAVKELCKVTDNLETRIDQLERINRRLTRLKRGDSLKSNSTVNSIKCMKHSTTKSDDELCSNKFIQVVIVVLVLIMAFCLAAITTLYLLEASRHNQLADLQAARRILGATKQPIKNKNLQWRTHPPPYRIGFTHGNEIGQMAPDSTAILRRPPSIIGRPTDCSSLDQDLTNTKLCRVYCCVTPPIVAPPDEMAHAHNVMVEHPPAPPVGRNRSDISLADGDKVARPFHTNDIEKTLPGRQRRDAYALTEDQYESSDDRMFDIYVRGQNFNASLGRRYLSSISDAYNLTYTVPISKYMPDLSVELIFRSTHDTSAKDIEYCRNTNERRMRKCTTFTSDVGNPAHHNTHLGRVVVGGAGIAFIIDTNDYQTKTLTYRVALRTNPSTNVCKMATTKLGIEFYEYNFQFYRYCDE